MNETRPAVRIGRCGATCSCEDPPLSRRGLAILALIVVGVAALGGWNAQRSQARSAPAPADATAQFRAG